MLTIPPELSRRYDTWLERKGVAVEQRSHYRKWLRFYWDFCHKYAFEPTERQSFPAFHEKLRAKNQPEALCRQAEQAVIFYYEMVFSDGTAGRVQPAEAATPPSAADKPGRVRSAYLFRALPGMACYQSYARNEGTRCVPYAGVDVAV